MDQHKIDRINALARKSKTEPLTAAELDEQKTLREEYLAGFRRNLKATLDNTYIQRPDGSKEKLSKPEK